MTPDLLAALAQVETSGNPIARTYWRWSLTDKPFEIYKPASSAVGMFQMTEGNFAVARRLCIHDHAVVADGPWHSLHSCWFNWSYMRVIPTNAVEMTSAYLDRAVTEILARHKLSAAPRQMRQLAAVIHLCGAGTGESYARRGLHITVAQRCGDHDVRHYLIKVEASRQDFARRMHAS